MAQDSREERNADPSSLPVIGPCHGAMSFSSSTHDCLCFQLFYSLSLLLLLLFGGYTQLCAHKSHLRGLRCLGWNLHKLCQGKCLNPCTILLLFPVFMLFRYKWGFDLLSFFFFLLADLVLFVLVVFAYFAFFSFV